MCMFFGNGSLESLSENLLFGFSQLTVLVLKYWASSGYMLYWQLRSARRRTRFEVGGLCAFFSDMISFVCGLDREIVGWLFSIGQVSLAILSFALRLALLTAVIRCETNSFWLKWFMGLCSEIFGLRYRARSCWLTVFIGPCPSPCTELRFETRFFDSWGPFWGSRFEVTGLCDCFPIMVSFVRVFGREIVGWLVSVDQFSLAIVSFASSCAQLKTVMNRETNSFWINWLLRMFFDNGSLESSSKNLLVGCFLLAVLDSQY